MAKTPRLKNSNKAPSPHSRLSRRRASSSFSHNINHDKSLPQSTPSYPSSSKRSRTVLAAHPGAGVKKVRARSRAAGLRGTAEDGIEEEDGDGIEEEDGDGIEKARGKAKVLKRKQRIRLERGKERAESVGDKMERKKGLEKKGVGRGADWDELNEKIGAGAGKRKKTKTKKKREAGWEDEDEDMDVDEDIEGGKENKEAVRDAVPGVVDIPKTVEAEAEAEEEIL